MRASDDGACHVASPGFAGTDRYRLVDAVTGDRRRALDIEPGNLDFQYALADHYLKRDLVEQAVPVIERMIETHPENPIGRQMMDFVRRGMNP